MASAAGMDVAATGTEAAAVLVFLLVMRFVPKNLAHLLLAALAWGLRGLVTKEIRGADVVAGRGSMVAAVFAPQAQPPVEHGVRMERVPLPDHTAAQVLVRTQAAGLNPSNFKINMARIPVVRHLRAPVVGYDCAGVALSVGSECEGLAVGDELFGFASGSIAEFAVLDCSAAARRPRSLSAPEAAGLPVAALTSLMALQRAELRQDQQVLVLGASGGCGIFGVLIAKLKGAQVTALCSGRNAAFVAGLGADVVVDYTDEEQMQALLSGGPQFDVVYDTVTSFAPEDPDYEVTMRPLLREAGDADGGSGSSGRYVAINGAESDWRWMLLEQYLVRPLGLSWRVQRPGAHHPRPRQPARREQVAHAMHLFYLLIALWFACVASFRRMQVTICSS